MATKQQAQKLGSWGGLSDYLDVNETGVTNVLDIELIEIPTTQSRKYFDVDSLNALAENIKEVGILQPVLVRSHPSIEGKYELISGERRLRAARIAQLTEIPVTIRECDDKTAKNIQLFENLNREQLNAYEETRTIMDILMSITDLDEEEVKAAMIQIANITQGKIYNNVIINPQIGIIKGFFAQTLMTCESFVNNRIPILSLPEDIVEYLATGKIEYTKALVIRKIDEEEVRGELLSRTHAENLSLTQVKEMVSKLLNDLKDDEPAKKITLVERYNDLGKRLSKLKKKIPPKLETRINQEIDKIESLLATLSPKEAESESDET